MCMKERFLLLWMLTCMYLSVVKSCIPMRHMDTTTVPAEGGQRTTMGGGNPPSTAPGGGTTPPGGGSSPGGVATPPGGGTPVPGGSTVGPTGAPPPPSAPGEPSPPGTLAPTPPGVPGTPTLSQPPGIPGNLTPSPPAIPGTPTPGQPDIPGTPIPSPPSIPGTPATNPPAVPGTPAPTPPAVPGTPTPSQPGTPGTTVPGQPPPSMISTPGQVITQETQLTCPPAPMTTSSSGMVTFSPGQPGTPSTVGVPLTLPPGMTTPPGMGSTVGVPLTLPPGMTTPPGMGSTVGVPLTLPSGMTTPPGMVSTQSSRPTTGQPLTLPPATPGTPSMPGTPVSPGPPPLTLPPGMSTPPGGLSTPPGGMSTPPGGMSTPPGTPGQPGTPVTTGSPPSVTPATPTMMPTTTCINVAAFQCPPGWTMLPNTNMCYQVVRGPLNWDLFQATCASFNSTLASIHSVAQNNFLAGLVTASNVPSAYIGLRSVPQMLNTYTNWVDGTMLDFIRWSAGRPNSPMGDNCVAMVVTAPSSGRWTDGPCATTAPAGICQRQVSNVPQMICGGGTTAAVPGTLMTTPGTGATPATMSVPGMPPAMTTSGTGPTMSMTPVVTTATVMTTTTTCVTARTTEPCGDGYQYVNATNFCYRLLRGPATWAQFRGFCMNAGGDIISIHNDDENNYALSVMRTAGLTTGLYIGLMSMQGTVNTYTRWSDGTPIDFTRWGHGNPSGNGNPMTCITFWQNEGTTRWDDIGCGGAAATICKRNPRFMVAGECLPEMEPTTPVPPETTTQACQADGGMACAPGWSLLGQFCYAALGGGMATWDAFNSTCNDYGAQMISIHSDTERNFVRQLTTAAGLNTYYIGLRSIFNNTGGTVYDVWSDGTLIDYSNFNYDARILGRTQDVLCIQDSNTAGRTWVDRLCNTPLAGTVCKRLAMCSNLMPPITVEVPTRPTTTSTTTTTTTTTCMRANVTDDCGGDAGWTYVESSDSCFFINRVARSWAQQVMSCMMLGGDLASIHNDDEHNTILMLMMNARITNGLYIGLMSEPNTVNTYDRWSDGTPLDFTRWGHGNPSGNGNPQTCIVYWLNEGVIRWDDIGCSSGMGLCRRPARHLVSGECLPEMPPPTTAVPPRTTTAPCMTSNGEMECPTGWTVLGQNCYMAVRETGTWDQLNSTCVTMGANMISIHSTAERNLAARLATAAGVNTYYIGLRSIVNNTGGTVYDVWSDGTIVDYSNFNYDARILGRTGNSLCIRDTSGNGRTWNDNVCTGTQPGTVCKQTANCNNLMPAIMVDVATVQTTTTTTTTPTTTTTTCVTATTATVCGGMGYTYLNATNFCYTRIDTAASWATIRQRCLNEGGDLASIHSDAENDWLSVFARGGTGYYLGAITNPGDPFAYNEWSDGTPMDFTRWSRGNPSGNDPNGPNCLVYYGTYGKFWDDYWCTGMLNGGFCKRPPLARVGECLPTMPATTQNPPTQATTMSNNPQQTTTIACPAANPCPANWQEFSANCYTVIQQANSNFAAFNTTCSDMSGTLASIHSLAEWTFVTMLGSATNATQWFIGLQNAANETTPVYEMFTDGSVINFGNWVVPRPTGNGARLCGFGMNATLYGWNDINCAATNIPAAICKMEAMC